MSIRMHRYDDGLTGLAAFCDTCGERIESDGYVLWDPDNPSDWIVIHKEVCDPWFRKGDKGKYSYSQPLDVEIVYLARSVSADLGKAEQTANLMAMLG